MLPLEWLRLSLLLTLCQFFSRVTTLLLDEYHENLLTFSGSNFSPTSTTWKTDVVKKERNKFYCGVGMKRKKCHILPSVNNALVTRAYLVKSSIALLFPSANLLEIHFNYVCRNVKRLPCFHSASCKELLQRAHQHSELSRAPLRGKWTGVYASMHKLDM